MLIQYIKLHNSSIFRQLTFLSRLSINKAPDKNSDINCLPVILRQTDGKRPAETAF